MQLQRNLFASCVLLKLTFCFIANQIKSNHLFSHNRNNTHCSELHHLFNSVKGKEMQKTDIQAVGYCL